MGLLDIRTSDSDVNMKKPTREKVNVTWEDGDSVQFYGKVTSIDDQIIAITDKDKISRVFRNSSNPVSYVEEVDE